MSEALRSSVFSHQQGWGKGAKQNKYIYIYMKYMKIYGKHIGKYIGNIFVYITSLPENNSELILKEPSSETGF